MLLLELLWRRRRPSSPSWEQQWAQLRLDQEEDHRQSPSLSHDRVAYFFEIEYLDMLRWDGVGVFH